MGDILEKNGVLFREGEIEKLIRIQVDPAYVSLLLNTWSLGEVRKYIDALLDKPGHDYESVTGPARDDCVGNSC